MEVHMLDGHLGRSIEVDLCEPCQSLWFDGKENLQLTPGSILEMFRAIGEHVRKAELRDGELVKCPRCKAGCGAPRTCSATRGSNISAAPTIMAA
jgi:hypothetical protein